MFIKRNHDIFHIAVLSGSNVDNSLKIDKSVRATAKQLPYPKIFDGATA